jgi:cytosine/adenosine deaminase-related metal-dependent hydrolase
MRWAAVVSKMVDRNTEVATAREVFNAATLGGAKALGRDDLGRIAADAKADLLVFDSATLNMSPMRDPVKNLVYYAEMEDLHTVIIDGETVLENGRALTVNQQDVVRRLQEAGERMWPKMAEHDWAGRDVDQLSPLTFPAWVEPENA